MDQKSPRVVIVGAGFGGLMAARGLAGTPARVTVIDRANHHLFQPLLYQVATAALSPAHIAAPIRDILHRQRNAEVFLAEVVGVDTDAKCLLLRDRDPVQYDVLILAPGAKYNYFGHDEWEKHAPSLKTLADAVSVRQDILLAFEAAEMEKDPERRRALLTFALVGGGPTGVEMAGSIAELAHRALSGDFRHIRPAESRILLLEASHQILGMFPDKLANAARGALERLRVEVRTDARVEGVEPGVVIVNDERIPCSTVLWTAGVVAAVPLGTWLGVETDRAGRVLVKPDLSVPGRPDIFVIGDAAHVEHEGKPLPGVAPVAMQQGRYVAAVIRARMDGKTITPFHYHDKGNLATVGRAFAIMDLGRIKLSGFIAWFLWLWIHIWYLIGFRNKASVFFQWAHAYLTWQRAARLITGPIPAPGSDDG